MTNQLPTDVEFDSIIPQLEKTSDNRNKPIFDERNYLNTSVPEGKKSREVTIRLLPVSFKDGKPEFFQIVHLHSIPVNKELNPNKSGKKAYMCLNAKNPGLNKELYGDKCPVCEAQQELWKQWREATNEATKKEILKEIKNLEIREYCIVRCIERGKENEGPKFWRIPLRVDETDAFHKIVLLGKTRKEEGLEAGEDINIFSLYKGRDLIVTFTEGTGAPTVVDKGISTRITKDDELLNSWFYDEKKWSDVFSTKPYDYLKLVLEGEVPWYDRDNKTWVTKTDIDNKKKMAENVANESIQSAESKFVNPNTDYTPSSSNIPTDEGELPF